MIWTLILILNFGYPEQSSIELADMLSWEACIGRGMYEMRNYEQPAAFRCEPGRRV